MKSNQSGSNQRVNFNPDQPPPTRKQLYLAKREIRNRLRVCEYNLMIARAATLIFGFLLYRMVDLQSAQYLLIALAGLFVALGFILQGLDRLTRNPVSMRQLKQRLRDFDRLETDEIEQAQDFCQRWPELKRYADLVKRRQARSLVYGELLMFMAYDLAQGERQQPYGLIPAH